MYDYTNIKFKYKLGWKIDNNYKNILLNNFDNNKKNLKILVYPSYYNIYELYNNKFPEIIDQKNDDTCVSNCILIIFYYLCIKQNNILKIKLSSKYLHYLTKLEYYNNENDFSGIRIIDCLKICKNIGICPDFIISQDSSKIKNICKFCKIELYHKINRYEIKKFITDNWPIICGIKIFSSFYNKKTFETGIIKIPNKDDEFLGGHCIIIVGYDDINSQYIFINTWGNKWGNEGIGYIKYNYIAENNYSDEFFVIKKISNPDINIIKYKNSINKKELFINIFILILILFYHIKCH